MKPYVLITGASSGIGYEFAKRFALEGYPVIMVSSNDEKLSRACSEIKDHIKNCEIIKIVQDLSKRGVSEELYHKVQDLNIEVGILINNAGIGYAGEFIKSEIRQQEDLMMLNMNNLVLLTHYIAKDMVANKSGKILNVASNGAFQPGPYIGTYYATKSFVLSFSQALRRELKSYGITVSTLCPGETVSDFARRAGKQQLKFSMPARKVADVGYRGLMKGKNVILPGIHNKAALLVPKKIRSLIIAKVYGNI
ncbi:SDR family NAD(P)-dependent oxidoreductase [Anaerosporobacter sp.]